MTKEELEKENAELEKACDETQELLDKQIEATFKLDKENAELKAKNKWYADQVCNAECSEVWGNLTKAKELLKKVVTDFHNMDCVTVHIDKTIAEAEQFLKESEVEKNEEVQD